MNKKYETVNVIERLLKMFLFFWVPIFFCECLFVRHGSLGRKIKKLATSYKALEIIYDYSWGRTKGEKMINRVLDHALSHFTNAKAVRNRFRQVKELIGGAIDLQGAGKRPIRILSLASGSGRDIFEVMSEMDDINASITLVDISKNALKDAEEKFRNIPVKSALERKSIEEFVRGTEDSSFNIILMIGYLDYLKEREAVDVISRIYRMLSLGGVFITCNVQNNPEKLFMDKVLKWPMVYRTSEGLADVMRRSGFQNPRIISENLLGVHLLAVGEKPKNP